MADVEWGSEAKEAPKPKKRIPTWLWFCGGGCLLALVVGITLTVVAIRLGMQAADPDRQWAELKAELPFDERPADVKIIGTGALTSFAPGIDDQWTLVLPDKNSSVQITKFAGNEATEFREQIESGDLGAEAKQQFGPFGLFELGHGVVDVQGRELHWIRFQTFEAKTKVTGEVGAEVPSEKEETDAAEPGILEAMSKSMSQRILMLDITPENGAGALVAQISMIGEGDPADPQVLVEFLKPFHIGPNR